MAAEITAEARELVAGRVTSIEQLDVLMLLFRDRDRSWSAAEISSHLGIAPESAGMRLFLLSSVGLLHAEGSPDTKYRFSPAAAFAVPILTALHAVYDADRQGVADDLFGSSPDPVRKFADAFKLKK